MQARSLCRPPLIIDRIDRLIGDPYSNSYFSTLEQLPLDSRLSIVSQCSRINRYNLV
jgi:hypothetical protein